MRRYMFTLEWTEWDSTRGRHTVKDNCVVLSDAVDLAMEEAKKEFDREDRHGLVVTNIYSEDAY